MRRIRLLIEYDGTAYAGWQTQSNGLAIQQVIEAQIEAVTGEHAALHGSGRTDSRVHAAAQVAHFDTQARMPADKFAFALNAGLPRDIRILRSDEAPSDFHARFDVIAKQYRYCVQTGPHARVFTRNTALHVHAPLDVEKMQQAAQYAVGVHDFRAFMSAGSTIDPDHAVREIFSSEWTSAGDLLYYNVRGKGFLYHMVRILVGTMLEVGKGKLPVNAIERAVTSGQRCHTGATAPAHGLTLVRVEYPHFDTAQWV